MKLTPDVSDVIADCHVDARRVVEIFSAADVMLATAESCTGGLLSGMITSISGSSSVLDRGFVTYSNEAKMEMLGVREATLAAHGAVSAETAAEMARGALTHSRAQYAVAVTGVAGPGGGSAEKPVGLVYLGLAGPDNRMEIVTLNWQSDWDRELIRVATVHAALEALIDMLT